MAPDAPYHGTRIVGALRIATEVKRANILHPNGDIQMNFPQMTAISAKMGVELTAIHKWRAASPSMMCTGRPSGQIAVREDERGPGRAQTGANANPNSRVARSRAESSPFSFRQPNQRIDIATIQDS
jgi:hypothetical protein